MAPASSTRPTVRHRNHVDLSLDTLDEIAIDSPA